MDKPARRRECFARIKSLAPAERSAASARIRSFLAGSPLFRQANTIFSYAALSGEPDLGALVSAFPEKNWAFPKVDRENRLAFYSVAPNETLSRGTLGISEPSPLPERLLSPGVPDLVLVPGVSFDPASLTRLGRGKGHYDRYLSLVRTEKNAVTFIGVLFSVQFSLLQPEGHDVPMNRLVSEDGWIGEVT